MPALHERFREDLLWKELQLELDEEGVDVEGARPLLEELVLELDYPGQFQNRLRVNEELVEKLEVGEALPEYE